LLRVILYLFLCLPFASLRAQVNQQYLFTNITAREGLASNCVMGMVQDDQGYMWIGTLNGLQRYDGNRYITFRHDPADSKSIPGNYINFLYVDKKKNLWVNFSDGKMGRFDTRKFTFTETKVVVPDENILTAERVLIEDDAGNLLFHLRGFAITAYDKAKNEFSYEKKIIPTPAGWKILNIFYDRPSKMFWMGSDSGLVIFNTTNKHLNYKDHNIDQLAAVDTFGNLRNMFGLFIDSKKRFWFDTWPAEGSQVFCFDNVNKKSILSHHSLDHVFTYYHEPRVFIENQDGIIRIYGAGMLAEYDEAANEFSNIATDKVFQKTLYNNIVNSVHEDREQNIWVCTNSNGIYQFNPSAQLFRSFPHVNLINGMEGNGGVMSFVEEADGSFFYSAWGEGLFHCDANYKQIPLGINGLPEKNNITAWDMCKRKDGTVWMTMQGGGLIVYNPATKTARQYSPAVFDKRTLRQVTEDHEGNMWIGTQSRGVYKWSAAKAAGKIEEGFTSLTTVPRTLIEKLLVDNAGYLWVCTFVDGVYKVNPTNGSVVERYTSKGSQGKKLGANAGKFIFSNLINQTINWLILRTNCCFLLLCRTIMVMKCRTTSLIYYDTVRI